MVLIYLTLCVLAGVLAWMHPGPLAWILGPLAVINGIYVLALLGGPLWGILVDLAPCLAGLLAHLRPVPRVSGPEGPCQCPICLLENRGFQWHEPDPFWTHLASRQSYPKRKFNQI